MSDSKDAWTKTYEEDATLYPSSHNEGDAMLQLSPPPNNLSTSPSSSTIREDSQPLEDPQAVPQHHSSDIIGPLIHEASSYPAPTDSTTPTPDLPLTTSSSSGNIYPRSQPSVKSFAPSPLNPISPTGPSSFPPSPFNRSGSRASTYINRIASEESRALTSHHSLSHPASRGSMILYKCVELSNEDVLHPPALHRNSVLSISGDSIVSLSADSKYPTRTISERGLIAYAYDPSLDDLGSGPAEDDYLHNAEEKFPRHVGILSAISFRGIINILALVSLIGALLCLFVVYPVIRFYNDNARNSLITFNTKINISGQANSRRSQTFFAGPIPLIDDSTPLHARVLKTAQDIAYGLVFSDEFTQNGRSFSAGNDLVWETSSKSDVAYDPSTDNGSLLVRLDSRHGHGCIENRVPGGWKRGDEEKDQGGRDRCLSGILKMKVPFCLSRGGLVEVGLRKTDFEPGSWSGLDVKGGVGKGEEELRRLIFWPGSSDSWSPFNQSESPYIPPGLLASDSDSGSLLALSIGVPIDDLGRTGSADESGRSRAQVELDYVRIYQPFHPLLPQAVTEEDCATVRNDVMLDLLQVLV